MPQLAAIIDGSNVHHWLVHFPLVLLLMAPLFAIGGAFARSLVRRTLFLSATMLLAFGLVCVHVTVGAGQQAAGSVAEGAERLVLDRHIEIALLARECFTVATLLLALWLLIPRLLHLPLSRVTAVLPLGAVLFYGLGMVWLLNAAYHGERLAHGFR